MNPFKFVFLLFNVYPRSEFCVVNVSNYCQRVTPTLVSRLRPCQAMYTTPGRFAKAWPPTSGLPWYLVQDQVQDPTWHFHSWSQLTTHSHIFNGHCTDKTTKPFSQLNKNGKLHTHHIFYPFSFSILFYIINLLVKRELNILG